MQLFYKQPGDDIFVKQSKWTVINNHVSYILQQSTYDLQLPSLLRAHVIALRYTRLVHKFIIWTNHMGTRRAQMYMEIYLV